MEPEVPFVYSQQSANGNYYEPHESGPHPPNHL